MGMKQARQWALSFILILTLVCGCGLAVFADGDIDPDETGSISVTLKSVSGKVLSGGELALYRIAEIIENPGKGSEEYQFLPAYAQCGEKLLENLSSSKLPQELEKYVIENDISPDQTKKIGSDGRIVFSDLKTGLYLIRQTEDSSGYKTVSPFVVSVPLRENGSLVYDVDASPKVEPASPDEGQTEEKQTEQKQTEGKGSPGTEKESEKVTKSESEQSTKKGSSEETLPQTGALIWPIVMLALIGSALIAGGIFLIREKKTTEV